MKVVPLAASLSATAAALAPATAVAHPGHWAETGGHDHWVALGALGLAGLLTLAALVRARKRRDDEAETAEDGDEDATEAEA